MPSLKSFHALFAPAGEEGSPQGLFIFESSVDLRSAGQDINRCTVRLSVQKELPENSTIYMCKLYIMITSCK